jgi:hypothetical protein
MRSEDEFAEEEIEDVPVSPLLGERKNQYGSVPGLDDEELADPRELERQVMLQEWGPVLMLPVRGRNGGFRPELDEEGLEWGAFATVDFKRTMPEFDKARYKADRLREKLRDILITLSIVMERLPGNAKYRVLKYLRRGIIDEEHIASEDMLAVAKLDARARRLQTEITELRKASWERWETARQRRLRCLEA